MGGFKPANSIVNWDDHPICRNDQEMTGNQTINIPFTSCFSQICHRILPGSLKLVTGVSRLISKYIFAKKCYKLKSTDLLIFPSYSQYSCSFMAIYHKTPPCYSHNMPIKFPTGSYRLFPYPPWTSISAGESTTCALPPTTPFCPYSIFPSAAEPFVHGPLLWRSLDGHGGFSGNQTLKHVETLNDEHEGCTTMYVSEKRVQTSGSNGVLLSSLFSN